MKRIPIAAAKKIADEYGYHQVIVYARNTLTGGEHMTTYGASKDHCQATARMGDTLKRFMGWNV